MLSESVKFNSHKISLPVEITVIIKSEKTACLWCHDHKCKVVNADYSICF